MDLKEAIFEAARKQIEQAIKVYGTADDQLTESQSDYALDLAGRVVNDPVLAEFLKNE